MTSSGCGGRVYPNGTTGVWTPGFPGNYPDDANCYWRLSSVANITVTFSHFDLESYYDYLYLYDGGSTTAPLIGEYTGSVVPPPATSSTNQLYLKFTSDDSYTESGFKAHFRGKIKILIHQNTNVYIIYCFCI